MLQDVAPASLSGVSNVAGLSDAPGPRRALPVGAVPLDPTPFVFLAGFLVGIAASRWSRR